MPTLQSLLAVYGSIDQTVQADPDTRAPVAARYLPSYSDRSAPGWYLEIQALAERHRRPGVDAVAWPDFSEAIEDLERSRDALTDSEVGRLVFALGTLTHLDEEFTANRFDDFIRGLGIAVPTDEASAETREDRAEQLLELIRSVFVDRDAWPELVEQAISQQLLTAQMEFILAPCFTGWKLHRNDVAAQLATEHSAPGAAFDDVTAVLDPLNWDNCYPSFFCAMTPLAANGDGWSQALEEIGVPCDLWVLRTGIKYWKGELNDGGLRRAFVNYDLCDTRPPGDSNEVVVDHGFIDVQELPNNGGVLIRTEKNIAFRTTGFTAAAFFACVVGWADAGRELILGCASRRGGQHGWSASEPVGGAGQGGQPESRARSRTAEGTPRVAFGTSQGAPPPGLAGAVIDRSVAYTNACIQETAATTGALLQKTADGTLTADDLVSAAATASVRLWLEPIRMLGLALAPPAVPPSPSPPAPGERRDPR